MALREGALADACRTPGVLSNLGRAGAPSIVIPIVLLTNPYLTISSFQASLSRASGARKRTHSNSALPSVHGALFMVLRVCRVGAFRLP